MNHDSNGCSPPITIAIFVMLAIYGIRLELPDNSPLDRFLRVMAYASPILLVALAYLLLAARRSWQTYWSRRERMRREKELESQKIEDQSRVRREARLAVEKEEEEQRKKLLRIAEEEELQQLKAREEADFKKLEAERKAVWDWQLKSARLECERLFEVFRPLIREDFTESRFQKLLNSHLGDDCPVDRLPHNKDEIIQMVTMLVGERTNGNERIVSYHDAPSAIDYFQREIDRINDMEIDEDDKEMLTALVRKRRVTVLDGMINDDTDNSR